MDQADARATIDRLCRERGEDFAGLSRLLGRNAAYVQQFVRRGVPRRLDERDRALLARYFGIDERDLGAPETPRAGMASRLRAVPVLDVGASAGPGGLVDAEGVAGTIAFDERYLREVAGGDPAGLSLIRVRGDSMAPTLADGDAIMVDRGAGAEALRDGIYVLRRDEALVVKRLRLHPATHRVAICSDNPLWPDEPDCDPSGLQPVGRVVWSGGRIG